MVLTKLQSSEDGPMVEQPEQNFKMESNGNDDDGVRERFLNEVYPLSQQANDYLNRSPEVSRYVEATESAHAAENLLQGLPSLMLVSGIAYGAGFKSAAYGLAATSAVGLGATLAKAEASIELEKAADSLTAPEYADLLEAGRYAGGGEPEKLTAASLAWSAALPMVSLAVGNAGNHVDRLNYSWALGAAISKHLYDGNIGVMPMRTEVEELAKKHNKK
jgi:hypothetical protein